MLFFRGSTKLQTEDEKKSYHFEEKLIPMSLVNCVHCVGHAIAYRMLKTFTSGWSTRSDF